MQSKFLAIYIRLSVEDGDLDGKDKMESNSITNQKKMLSEFCKSRPDLSVYESIMFVDDGFSGTNFDRPQFQKMLEMAKQGSIACIVVKDLSRFGREHLDVSSYLERIFPLLKIRFISVNDHFDSNDYVGTTAGMDIALRNIVNGMYSRDISVKVKSALRTRHLKGEHTGGHPFYGYKKDPSNRHKIIVDENVRPNIELIYQYCIDGLSSREIAKTLNERGVLCPAEYRRSIGAAYNKPFSESRAVWIPSTVLKIINDERYTGKMISGTSKSLRIGGNNIVNTKRDEWIIVPGTHEAIISDETFQKAKQALTSRIRTVNQNTSWKNSKNLFVCEHCGRKLQKSHGKTIHMFCQKSSYVGSTSPCAQVFESLPDLESRVLAVVKSFGKVLTDGVKIISKQTAEKDGVLVHKITAAQDSIKKMREQKIYLYEQYRNGSLLREEFIAIQEENASETSRLSALIGKYEEELQQQREDRKHLLAASEEIRSANILTHFDPTAISKVVDKVIVSGNGNINVVFNNQDAIQRILDSQIE